MSHYLEQMFSVREAPWHINETKDRTTVLEEYPGRETAMKLAGHDFTLVERPIFVAQGDGPEIAPRWKAIVREDSEQVLDVANASYEIVQNDTLWDIVDAIVDLPNVRYETAGVLKEGAILWVLAWLDEPLTVPGDTSPIYPFVLVSSTHDGSGSAKAAATEIRVVCWNTWSAADAKAARDQRDFTFRHTKNVMARIEDAKAAIHGVRTQHSAFLALAEELAVKPVTEKGIRSFVQQFIPMPPDVAISDRVAQNIEEARAAVKAILDGPTCSGIRNSQWGLFQAGIEYLDYARDYRNRETLFGRTLLRPLPLKAKLRDLVASIR